MGRRPDAHDGITLQWDHKRHHVGIKSLNGGKGVTVYPQHEVLKGLIAAHLATTGKSSSASAPPQSATPIAPPSTSAKAERFS